MLVVGEHGLLPWISARLTLQLGSGVIKEEMGLHNPVEAPTATVEVGVEVQGQQEAAPLLHQGLGACLAVVAVESPTALRGLP